MAKRYTMTLSAPGNPDFGQYAPVAPKETVEAATLDELRDACRVYIEKYDLGGGNWKSPIVREGKRAIGYFSYNLRLWKGSPKNWKDKEEILLDTIKATVSPTVAAQFFPKGLPPGTEAKDAR